MRPGLNQPEIDRLIEKVAAGKIDGRDMAHLEAAIRALRAIDMMMPNRSGRAPRQPDLFGEQPTNEKTKHERSR